MAQDDDGQEKTEEPTQKRRDDARKDGQVLSSTEVFVLTTLGAATLLLLMVRPLLPGVVAAWGQTLVIEPGLSLDRAVVARLHSSMQWVLWAGVGVGLPMAAVVLASQAAMGGINFAPKALGFKAQKINPLKGLQRMVSMKALVDLGKSVLKVALLLSAAVFVVWPLLPALELGAVTETGPAMAMFGAAMVRVLAAMLVGLALIGALDLGWQIHSNTKALRMSRQDIKDEFKESEGRPEVKGQIRRRQIEASQRAAERRALQDVPTASAIITNPTHFAVALRYEPGGTQAPVVVAMGRGPMAAQIIKRGRRAGVQVLRVPVLARALYFSGAIGQQISEQLYTAVAVVLAHVWRLEHGQPEPTPDVDVPAELRLDEFGRPMKGPKE